MVRTSILLFLSALLLGCSSPAKEPVTPKPAAPTQVAEAPIEKPAIEIVAVKRQPGEAPPDVQKPPSTAIEHESIFYTVLKPGDGSGVSPTLNDQVEVHYEGWTADGEMFDSSRERGKPAKFGLTKVIEGWRRAVPLMTTGQIIRLWIPKEMAYEGRPGAPQGMLVFEVELLKIHKAPAVPSNVAGPPDSATTTMSGLAYQVLRAGTGTESPDPQDRVEVHYSGWTTDGKMFDSSVTRNQTAKFPLTGVIPGWTEVLGLMVVGEKIRVWIPKELAYEDKPGRPAGMLVFDIELLTIENITPPPAPPKNVAKPPRRAKRTKSGLRYQRLTKGPPGPRPTAKSRVEVHYTGWTTDGKMFDSSVARGKPMKFPLTSVIAGWTEGVMLMRVGDKTRFWIPEKLAYKGSRGKPAGILVFDIELLSFEP